MFLTTPNSACIGNIFRILKQYPVYFYEPHVREYTFFQLLALLRDHNFSIVKAETIDVWHDLPSEEHQSIMNMLQQHGASLKYRGECTFVIARK
jgi:hypothetical protein